MEKAPTQEKAKTPEKMEPYVLKRDTWKEYLNSTEHPEAGKRVDDIEVEGKLLSTVEKSPLQQESVEMSLGFIQERLQELDIQGRSFDLRRITFVNYYGSEGGRWKGSEDWITLPSYAEARVSTIVHEATHALASEWQYLSQVERDARQERRTLKTGFSTYWNDATSSHDNFDLLNEAVTEKIARDMVDEHRDKVLTFTAEHADRLDGHLSSLEKSKERSSERKRQELAEELKELEAKETASIERLVAEGERNIRIDMEIGRPEDAMARTREFTEKMIALERGHYKRMRELEESYAQMDDIKWQGLRKEVESAWQRPTESQAYQEGVEMLETILDGLAVERARSTGKDETDARKEVWGEMQRAYFNGDVMWLRNIEHTFGDGMLRRIGTLPHPQLEMLMSLIPSPEGEKKRENAADMKGILQKKIEEMREI